MNTQSCNLISVQPNAVSCLLSYPSSYHFAGPAWWIIIARKSYTNTDTKLGHSTFEMLDPADTKTYNIASRPDGGDMWLRSFKLDERFAKHDAGSEKCTGNCNVDKTRAGERVAGSGRFKG